MEREQPSEANTFEARRKAPTSDFEVVWKSGEPGKMQYSLVEVPEGRKFGMFFHNLEERLAFTMQPDENSHLWTVTGRIDTDIISNLGLPVTRERRGTDDPFINKKMLSQLRALGDLDEIDHHKYDAEILVTPEHILHLLDKVWMPQELRKSPGADIPDFRLDADDSTNSLLLPQKEPPQKQKHKKSWLQVYRPA